MKLSDSCVSGQSPQEIKREYTELVIPIIDIIIKERNR